MIPKNKLKPLFGIFLSAVMLLETCLFGSAKSCSWYTVPTKDGSQPDNFESRELVDSYHAIYLGSPDEKVVYLTFDAGYENGNVEKVLDTLKKHNVPAAFFVLPHLIKANTSLVLRMADEGHLVCSHSTTHSDMSKITDPEVFKKELTDIENVYRETTGRNLSKFFRPPEGRFSEQSLKYTADNGYTTVFWSLAYADWDNKKQMDCDKALDLILSRMHNGCVLLLHPTSNTNAAILDRLISRLKEQGYTFGTLDRFNRKDTACS